MSEEMRRDHLSMGTSFKTTKKIYLECLRVISLFGVIYCHTDKRGLLLYEVTADPAAYYFSKIMLLFSQICVPVFFMISGSLLLGRQEDLKKNFKHRVLKYTVILCVVVFFQYGYNCLGNPALCLWYPELKTQYPGNAFSLWKLFRGIYSGGALTQHWFLYAYLSFLLILPFFQKMVQGLSRNYLWYLLFLCLLCHAAFPFVERWQHFPESTMEFPFMTHIIFYPLLGYFLDREEIFTKGRVVVAVLSGAFFWTIFNVVLMENNKELFLELNIFLFAAALFIAVKYLFGKITCPEGLQRFYVFCGKGVFGTYLLEYLLRNFCEPIYRTVIGLGEIPALFVWIFCVMALGILLTNGFYKIKKGLAFHNKKY